jgi:hypothetical protein
MVAEHPIELRGLGLLGTGTQPTLLERTDQDFISALLDEMGKGDQFATLRASVMPATAADTPLRFFQPVHRTFYLAVCEAVCDYFQEPALAMLGQPRLDPQAIEGSGLVVRRITPGGGHEAWLQGADKRLRGWVRLTDDEQDPDPAFRRAKLTTGIAELDARLGIGTATIDSLSESVSGLFVAPPEVCAANKKTLLYGLIPVTSSEYSEAPPQDGTVSNEPEDDLPLATVRAIFPVYLSGTSSRVPLRLDAARRLELDFQNVEDKFVSVLRWLLELQAFEATPEGQAVLAELNKITMVVDLGGLDANVTAPFTITRLRVGTGGRFEFGLDRPIVSVRAGDFLQAMALRLRDAADDLTAGNTPALSGAAIPWNLTSGEGDAVLRALQGLMKQRLIDLNLPQGEKRFDRPGVQYQVRAFIRVRHPGCPPDTWWSPYSQPFVIAPWHDNNGKVPPAQIALPDMNRDALKALKPNVAFVLPPALYDFLEKNKLDNFLPDGSASKGDGSLSLGWICSFSLPIITLCAFIVLNIFLSLFNIVFNWLFFIKICLPFPKRE